LCEAGILLQAGFGKVRVTPPAGSPLAGFAAREGVSTGTHDELFSRTLVFDNGSSAVAIVSLDVLAVSSEFVVRLRESIAGRVPIAPDAIMIACTHTHAGPVTISTFFNPEESVDPKYMEYLGSAIETTVAVAWKQRFDARIGIGSGRIEGLGVNRRTADGRPVDEEIGIIKVADSTGQTRAVLFNYACHPTVLGPDNLLASGDFPSMAIERIEDRLGSNGFAMYVNGTQGDISVGHSSELSAIGVVTPGRTFERATELGQRLGNAVLEVLGNIKVEDVVRLGFETIQVHLPLKQYPPPAESETALGEAGDRVKRLEKNSDSAEYRQAKTELLYRSIIHYYARETAKYKDGVLPIELQGIRVGDAVFVAVPGEVFVEIGLRVKQLAPIRTFIAGIANGYIGYLPSRSAYDAGGYEVVSSRCGPGSADRLVEAMLQLDDKLLG